MIASEAFECECECGCETGQEPAQREFIRAVFWRPMGVYLVNWCASNTARKLRNERMRLE